MSTKKPLVVFVVGPTATGKSEFAIEAAARMSGEILNTDSVQVYASANIGTAKPSAEQMGRIPHHLFGFVPEGDTCTAGDFRKAALETIATRWRDGVDTIFAVGGSGFYVQALEKGMYPAPDVPRHVRERIDADHVASGLAALYSELQRRDPAAAAGISANDTYRIKRALEINRYLQDENRTEDGERSWSEIRRRFERDSTLSRPFDVVKIGISRARPRIRELVVLRTRAMLERGLIEETRELRERCGADWAPLLSVGYKEVQEFIDGRLARADLESAIVTSTMQLVKRQTTWFRRDPQIQWFDADAGWDEPLATIERLVSARARAKDHG